MFKSSHQGLSQSVTYISLLTFVSRCLGMLRDLCVARYFGVSAAVDAYYLAARIPNLCRNLLAEGALMQALLPVLSELTDRDSKDKLKQFIQAFSGMTLLLLALLCVVGMYFSTSLIHLFAPGYEGAQFELAVDILRITFPFVLFIFLVAMVAAILNIHGCYLWPAAGSSVLNIVLIISVVLGVHYFSQPIIAQAYGLVFGSALVLIIELIALHGLGLLVWPKIYFNHARVWRVYRMMLPAIMGASLSQLSILINSMYLSCLPPGSVGWLYYAERLAYFPLGVFTVSLSTVLLPSLSKLHAQKGRAEFIETLDWALRRNLVIGLFATLALYCLAEPLVICVYAYGVYSAQDVLNTVSALQAYALGLMAFMLSKTLLSAFHAQKDLATPLRLSIVSLILGVVTSAILIDRYAHVALALATSLSSWFYVLMLFMILHQRALYCLSLGILFFVTEISLSSLALFLTWHALSPARLVWLSWGGFARWGHLFLLGLVGFVVFWLMIKTITWLQMRLGTALEKQFI